MSLTIAIIIVTVLVSWAGFNNDKLLQRLLLWPPAVSRGRQYDRFIGYGLVHGDFMHLLFNMFTLYFFGRLMEQFYGQYLGPWGFLGFYASALVVSALPSYLRHRHDPNYATLGASGAVSAVLFAFVLLQPWATIYVYVIPVPAIIFAVLYTGYSVYMNHRKADQVNHSAHLAGAAYGVLFTVLMEPRVLGHFMASLLSP
ncbi:rhomboid family intramembrane serine protease [Arenimonas caeni]|uniref:Rhomboid family intramembrane serine protease n=1 Tax=Arenimonas caeni TaxID=2058085 RepID=A0A2P6MBK6_9GAMM|nr:rhomboid family intramembrane serine protease [Arenimonas caeni]MDY0022428.1 rhomboid family intramembrane serine protease [Arenimonas caeni]PRH83375.1 rhomboid family intramembrane serine protease [Arenimonas caeni]